MSPSGRPLFSAVELEIPHYKKIVADADTLLWMDESLEMSTGCYGGCCHSFARSLSGESCCMNTYTANNGPARASFGFDIMGDMMAFAVTPDNGWLLSDGAFVAGDDGISVKAKFAGCCVGCLGDEGFFFTHIKCTEPATFYAGGFGSITKIDVAYGQTLLVDRGLFFACSDKTKMRMAWLSQSIGTRCCTPDSISVRFDGPCVVYTQVCFLVACCRHRFSIPAHCCSSRTATHR